MLSLRKINPMARAVGTMGIVATMVGAVTFAQLTSNTVALTPNTMTIASASLVIGSGSGGCGETAGTSTTGINAPSLAPGGSATPVTFCIKNTGSVALNLSAVIPEQATLAGDSAAQKITFGIDCGPSLGSPSTLLSAWSPETFAAGSLAAGSIAVCTASASLNSSYSTGGHVVPAFSVQFTGTQV